MDHDRILELVPLYALDALEEIEAGEVELHLETCDECNAELAMHRTVTAGLVMDEEAPSHVWDRISAEIADPDPKATVTSIEERSKRFDRRIRWFASVAALAALVLGAVAIFQAVNDPRGPEAVLAAAEAAAEQPGAIVADFTTDTGTVGRVVLTADGEGFILPTDLEPLDDDRTYQLWVLTPDAMAISAGVLGSAPVPSRFTWNGEPAGFALTREVAGGVPSTAGDLVSAIEL
jgi:anti-sigma-K factor RskA